jgi:hypothetical protein
MGILKAIALYTKSKRSVHNKSAKSLARSDTQIRINLRQFKAAKGVEPKLHRALIDLHEAQLVINSLIRDLNNQIFALDFHVLAKDKTGYLKSILQHIVVLVIAFDEKVNTTFLNSRMQEAVTKIASGNDANNASSTELRKALKKYNKLSNQLRSTLTTIRKTIGAHRDPSDQAIQDAIRELGSSGIVEIVKEIFELSSVYSTISASALKAMTFRLASNQRL